MYFRLIDEFGDIYEGGYYFGNNCGKGMIEYYKEIRKEYGSWKITKDKGGVEHGEFICEYDNGVVIKKWYFYGRECV